MQMTNLKDFSPRVVSHENRSGNRPWGKTRDTEESQEIRASVFVGSPPPLLLGGWWMVLATTEQVVIRGTWTISLDNKSFSAEIFVRGCSFVRMSIATLMRYQDLAPERQQNCQTVGNTGTGIGYTGTLVLQLNRQAGVLEVDFI